MGLLPLRLTVKILANLRPAVNIFPLLLPKLFLRLTFISASGQDLSILLPNG